MARRGSSSDYEDKDPRQSRLEKEQIFREARDQLDEQIDDAVRTVKKLEGWKGAEERDILHTDDQHNLMNVVKTLASGSRIIRSAVDLIQESQHRILQDQVRRHIDSGDGASPMDTAEPVEAARPQLSTETLRQSMDTFHDSVFQDPRNFTHVLSVFYNKKSGPTLDAVASTKPELSHVTSGLTKTPSQRPQRLIINSDTLINELEAITSTSFGKVPVVVIPPYKALLLYWPEIQDRLESLKQLQAQEDGKDGDAEPSSKLSAGTAEHSNTAPSAPTRDHLEHLQCLVDFIQNDLNDVLEIRARIADGTIQKIAFADLWHLFSPGDTILSFKNGGEQALRVYCVTGGRYRFPDKTMRDRRLRSPIAGYRRQQRRYEIEQAYDRSRRMGLEAWSSDDGESSDDDSPKRTLGSYSRLCLDCFAATFDGSIVQTRRYIRRIDHYTGERHITDLPVYPIQFHDSAANILDRLTRRGERFISCHGHKLYNGPALKSLDTIQGEIYVDFKTGYDENKLLGIAQRNFTKLRRQIPDSSELNEFVSPQKVKIVADTSRPLRPIRVPIYDDSLIDSERADDFINSNRDLLQRTDPQNIEPGDERFCLFPQAVVAFSFRTRKWHFLDVNLVEDIDKSELARDRGFDDLVVSETYKQLLVALVENHRSGRAGGPEETDPSQPLPQMDIVRNKGQGICVLLHGPPGVGKTSTAETIAAYTKNPLYSITCGDMGIHPEEMEKKLEKHFALASKWGCVLLLDEADVFLMARDWQNVQRNASVSVFLRILEYYSGILFLTTNRVGVIDEAFKSRIHVSLRYLSLGLSSTKVIWENLLNRIERDNAARAVKVVFDKSDLLAYAESHYQQHEASKTTWNGRQIRNAFQTAIALGRAERLKKLKQKGITEEEAEKSGKEKYMRVQLTKSHFVKIARTARDFEDYLVSVRGSDAKTARDHEVRDDDYDPNAPRAQKSYGLVVPAPAARSARTPPGTVNRGKAVVMTPQISGAMSEDEDEDKAGVTGAEDTADDTDSSF